MDDHALPPTVLAADAERGWQVRSLGGPTLELDLGALSLMLSTREFAVAAWLATAGANSLTDTGLLASADPRHAVYRCPHTGIVLLMLDRVTLRFPPAELRRLAALCRRASRALGPITSAGAVPPLPFSLNERARRRTSSRRRAMHDDGRGLTPTDPLISIPY